MFWRRRFYRIPTTTIAAGVNKRVLYFPGKITIRQLHIEYDGDDSTGTDFSIIEIKIDGETLLKDTIRGIYRYLANYKITSDSDRPIVCVIYDTTNKRYGFSFHDLGFVKDGIEVWIENKDTSNEAEIRIGLVYDVPIKIKD